MRVWALLHPASDAWMQIGDGLDRWMNKQAIETEIYVDDRQIDDR